MSRFGGVKTFVVSLLQPLVSAGTLAVARGTIANALFETPAPSEYPGAFVSQDNPKKIGDGDYSVSFAKTEFSQDLVIILKVADVGLEIGAAEAKAWDLADTVMDAVNKQVPPLSTFPQGTSAGPLRIDAPYAVDVGQGAYGIAIPFTITIRYNL